ncbi:hypothetical protein HDE_14357 [Halotydeus destructor]|nr:hypothetical protein HDE_14357 [Halotydeus destructor]
MAEVKVDKALNEASSVSSSTEDGLVIDQAVGQSVEDSDKLRLKELQEMNSFLTSELSEARFKVKDDDMIIRKLQNELKLKDDLINHLRYQLEFESEKPTEDTVPQIETSAENEQSVKYTSTEMKAFAEIEWLLNVTRNARRTLKLKLDILSTEFKLNSDAQEESFKELMSKKYGEDLDYSVDLVDDVNEYIDRVDELFATFDIEDGFEPYLPD